MTLRNSPLAIDGALIDSATLRIQAYANAGGNQGVIDKGDLKVSPLTVAGNGLQVSHGAAVVLNGYQTDVDQAYVISNVNNAIIDSSQMPAASPSQRIHMVAVTIGDPEFSQAGHPWMQASDPPLGEEETFQYVRFHVLQDVPASSIASPQAAHRYLRQWRSYPALPLAALTIPANTTTITGSMLKDLRVLVKPRRVERIEHIAVPAGYTNPLEGPHGVVGAYEPWPPQVYFDLEIPHWAVRAKITGFVEGARKSKDGQGSLRIAFVDGGATEITNINEPPPYASIDRVSYNIGGEIDIPEHYRDTIRRIRIEATPNNANSQGFLAVDSATSGMIRVVLEEEAT